MGVLVLVLVLSNTKVVHRLDCSPVRIFGSTNLNPPSPHDPALHGGWLVAVVFVVAFVVVVVLHARCLCFACASQYFAMALKAFCPRCAPTTMYTQPRFTPTITYTKPPFTPTTLYTNHRLHHTTVYTKPRLTPTTVYTKTWSTPNHGLHQLHQPPFTPNRGLHRLHRSQFMPCSRASPCRFFALCLPLP